MADYLGPDRSTELTYTAVGEEPAATMRRTIVVLDPGKRLRVDETTDVVQSGVPLTGTVTYDLSLDQDEIVAHRRQGPEVLLKGPLRTGAGRWTRTYPVISVATDEPASTAYQDFDCTIVETGLRKVLGQGRHAVIVECRGRVGGNDTVAREVYAEGLGLTEVVMEIRFDDGTLDRIGQVLQGVRFQ